MIGLTLAVLFGALAEASPDRIVNCDDRAIPENWRLPKVLGKDFWPLLMTYGWVYFDAEIPSGMSVYRECARMVPNRALKGAEPFTNRYEFADLWGDPGYRRFYDHLLKTNELDRPLVIIPRGVRPRRLLQKEYPFADRESFAAWKAAHPNYVGFMAMGEIDSDGFNYPKRMREAAPEEMHRLEHAFPAAYADFVDDMYFRDKWIYEGARRSCEYFFGDTAFWGEPSWCPGQVVILADAGSATAGYEATGAQSAPMWTLGAACMRGAARLYGLPTYWYTANCYTGYTRDGKQKGGENRLVGNSAAKNAFGMKDDWWGPDNGLSPSLVARQNMYGWLVGGTYLQVENFQHCHMQDAAGGKKVPSVHAREFEKLHRLAKKVDRGIPYTPLAVLMPARERLIIEGYPEFGRNCEYSRTAAALTLVPSFNRRKEGIEGCFYNSEFGEIWDVVAPDIRSREDTAKALSGYRAAVLLGIYRGKSPDGALQDFVSGGGTLFVSADQIRYGTVSEKFAGVSFPGSRVSSAGEYIVDDRNLRFPLRAPYVLEEGKPTSAVPFWKDEKGDVIAYLNRFGKGRVISIAAAGMMPYGVNLPHELELESAMLRQFNRLRNREITCEIMRLIFARIQEDSMPIRVEGDVQWGVNKTARGWFVWMFNNKGVTHFMGEPQQINENAAARVNLVFDGFTPQMICDAETWEDLPTTFKVPAGRWRLVEIVTHLSAE